METIKTELVWIYISAEILIANKNNIIFLDENNITAFIDSFINKSTVFKHIGIPFLTPTPCFETF